MTDQTPTNPAPETAETQAKEGTPKAAKKRAAPKTKTLQRLPDHLIEQRNALQVRFQDERNALDNAIEEFNNIREEKWAAVAKALADLNEVVYDANAWQEVVASEIQEYIDEKSERWLESDKGQQYESWKGEFEEEIPSASVDEPEEISTDGIEDYSEMLGERSEELGGGGF